MPRGRGLGGGSSHNCMMYVRGHKEDYDRWAEMGAEGWSYKDVLPYFIKSEKTHVPSLQGSSKSHVERKHYEDLLVIFGFQLLYNFVQVHVIDKNV